MSKHRNRKTRCHNCQFQGASIAKDGKERATCLRHRMDGAPHILPEEWLVDLAADDIRCHLFQPKGKEAG
jgi:hypothetical protein